uniref:Uncharacterized protein n=1 Tax=viral metagenome TaxID=1070528 RepID=A0A6C0K1W0_9ZZZZ
MTDERVNTISLGIAKKYSAHDFLCGLLEKKYTFKYLLVGKEKKQKDNQEIMATMRGYGSIRAAYPPCVACVTGSNDENKEEYSPPVTLTLPQWRQYVAQGQNTFPGDAIVPGGTTADGAVYVGHVRQNPYTAPLPDISEEDQEAGAQPLKPYWYY